MLSVLATLFDPLFLLVAMVAVSLGANKHYIVPITSVFIGLLAETLTMKAIPGHQWGDSFSTLMAAGIIQATLAYFVVRGWQHWQVEQSAQAIMSDK